MSGQEAPRAHFAVMRLTKTGVPDTKPADDPLSEDGVSEEEAAVLHWPWLSNYRRLLEWGSGFSNVHACHEPDFPGFRRPPPA
jgi:hypothetical protein